MGDHHSDVVGGSTVNRFLNCPGAGDLSKKYPNETSTFAQEGTDLHTAMETLTDDFSFVPSDLLGEKIGKIAAIKQEQVDALAWCYSRVGEIIGDDEYALEKWGDFPGVDGAGGTADVTVFRDRTLVIADYKFGRGVPVSARGNNQLLFYACCMLEKYGMWGVVDTIEGHILQPRLDSHTTSTWTIDQAHSFVDQVHDAADNQGATYNIGAWCKFCRGKPGCPAQMDQAQTAYNWGVVARSDLPKALAITDELEDWIKEVRAAAHKALEAGQPVQGWKLVAKRGSRVWAMSDVNVEKGLYRRGLTAKQRRNTSLISPAQAEKLLGKEAIRTMVEAKMGKGTTLAREGDKRPAVSTGRSLHQLATAMSSNPNGEHND